MIRQSGHLKKRSWLWQSNMVLVFTAFADSSRKRSPYKYHHIKAERPILHIFHIRPHASLDFFIRVRGAAESPHLCQTGDPGFYVGPDVIIAQDAHEFFVLLRPMRARTDQAHLAFEDVDELRPFIDRGSAECAPKPAGAPVRVPRSKFYNSEKIAFHPDTRLVEKKGARRKDFLKEAKQGERWPKDKNEGKRANQIHHAFKKSFMCLFERLDFQSDHLKAMLVARFQFVT